MTFSSSTPRSSMLGSLMNIKALGFEPNTVIDVGAALGTFDLYAAFPKTKHFLIEPVAENEPYLDKICQQLANAEYIIAAATKEQKVVTLTVSPQLIHSSILDDSVPNAPSADTRTVPGITLDQVCIDKKLKPPYLLKIDVDGNEIEVINGAIEVLKSTEYVIIEVSLFNQAYEIINLMKQQGFVPYDIVDMAYRPLDNVFWQCDMAFVKGQGQFRVNRDYINEENKEFLTNHLKSYRENLINYVDTSYLAFIQNNLTIAVLNRT